MSLTVRATRETPQYTVDLGEPFQENDYKALSTKNFEDRALLIPPLDGNPSVYCVDTCILVTGPNEATRKAKQQELAPERDTATNRGHLSAACAVTSAAITALGVVKENPIVTIGGGIGIILSAFKADTYYTEASDLQDLMNQWATHPAQRVLDERKAAYKNGFSYAMKHQLKEKKILHPPEVSALYVKSLETVMRNITVIRLRQTTLTVKEREEWIQKFLDQGLVSQESLQYAYPDQNPVKDILLGWTPSFEASKRDYDSIKGVLQQKIQDAQLEASEKINRVEETRSAGLALLRMGKDLSDATSKNTWIEKTRKAWTQKEIGKAREEYEDALTYHLRKYCFDTTPIYWIADTANKNIEDQKALAIGLITKEKEKATDDFFRTVLNLFETAYRAASA